MSFRDMMKVYHWRTTNYARHKASDALILGLDPLIDQFVEVYLGKYPRPSFPSGQFAIDLVNLSDAQAVTALQAFKEFLLNDLSHLQGEMLNTDLLNIRDEMLALVNQTLYLFTLS